MKTNSLSILAAGVVGVLAAHNSLAETSGTHISNGRATISEVTQARLSENGRSVFENYFAIQSALARDSLKTVPAKAQALAAAAHAEEANGLPPQVAQQSDAVAAARGMAKTRKAFKALSDSLIKYSQTHGLPPGHISEVYCPIAKASWLQTGEAVRNPYLGLRSSTPTWGWACAGVTKAKCEDASSSNDRPVEGGRGIN